MEASAAYLPGSAARQPMHLTPQSSQRARGVEVWAVLASLGRDGVAALVDRTCLLARRFADGMREAGFDVLNDVVLNQVLVAFGDAARTDAVIAAVQQRGHLLVRADRLARARGHARQRQRLEHDRGRHRPEHRRRPRREPLTFRRGCCLSR